jgi:cell division FtsZ-interacting protein ZapD
MKKHEVETILSFFGDVKVAHARELDRVGKTLQEYRTENSALRGQLIEARNELEKIRLIAAEDAGQASEEDQEELAHRRMVGYPGFTK